MDTLEVVKTDSAQAPVQTLHRIVADKNGVLPNRIQILRAGNFATAKYGQMDITMADLHEMVTNFKAGVGLNGDGSEGAPINFGHKFGERAAAWIKGLEVDETEGSLYATPIEWSTAGEKAVSGKEYKFFSSEFWLRALGQYWYAPENTNQTATNVIDGGALTNIPLFNGQKAVTASREGSSDATDGLFISASHIKEKPMLTLADVLKKDKATMTDEDRQVLAANKDQLTDEQKATFGFETKPQPGQAQPVAASAVRGDEGTVVVAAKEIKELHEKANQVDGYKERIEKLEASTQESAKKEAQEFVKVHATRGAIKPDQIEKWTTLVLADAGNRELLEGLKDDPTLASAVGDGGGKQGDATDAIAEMQKKAQEHIEAARKAQESVPLELRMPLPTFAQAQDAIMKQDQELKTRVEAQRAGR